MPDQPLVKARTYEFRSPHNRVVTGVLCWFFGIFGVHRFYVGKFGTGLLMLLTGGGFGIWWIIDFILILLGRFQDSEGRVLGPPQVVYEQLPPPSREHRVPKQLAKPSEPELAPLSQEDIDLDDEVMRDPLEDKFADLERELGKK